jgi:hypothetical protein
MDQINLPRPTTDYERALNARLTDLFKRIRPASGWNDKEAPLVGGRIPAANAPTWANFRDGIEGYRFDAGQVNSIFLTFHMPHNMAFAYPDESGAMQPAKLWFHVHHATNDATPDLTNAIRWGFEWTYAHGFGVATFDASTTTTLDFVPSGGQYVHEIAELSDANAVQDDFETDGLILMRFFRDGATDSNTSDWWVPTVDLHYYSDGMLTNERDRNNSGVVPWTKQATP